MLNEKLIQINQAMIALDEQMKKTEHLLNQTQIGLKNLEKMIDEHRLI